jgi:hypothetical protein
MKVKVLNLHIKIPEKEGSSWLNEKDKESENANQAFLDHTKDEINNSKEKSSKAQSNQ